MSNDKLKLWAIQITIGDRYNKTIVETAMAIK